MCNFALQLESEVHAGQQAHIQLEEQYEALSQVGSISLSLSLSLSLTHLPLLTVCLSPPCHPQEKADLESRLEAREAVLMRKHEEMEKLHKQASENVGMHSRYMSPFSLFLFYFLS